MRKLFLAFLLLLLAPLAAKAQIYPAPPNVGLAANRPVNCVASNPGQPQEPQWYFATDTSVLSICVATNTWQNTTGGGGGGGIGGGGTAGFLGEWSNGTTIGNSLCQDLSSVLLCSESVSVGANAFMISKANAASGTTQFLAVSWDANRNAITALPGNSVRGIAGLGAGTSGTVQVAVGGEYPWTCDNQTVVNDWLVLSTTTAGECHDAGASEPTGVQNIAQVAGANSGSGTATLADIFTPDTANAPGGPPTIIQVNGSPIASTTANLNSTSPAAPSSYENLPFATDGLSPSGISLAAPFATGSQAGFLELNTDLGGSYTAPNVVGIQGIPCTLSGTPVAGQVWGFTASNACGNLFLGVLIRSVSTNSDTILSTDREKNIRYTATSGATAVTLPQSGSTGFSAGFTFLITNAQGSGTVTVTPTTSTINGASTLAIIAGNYCFVYSDGTNYFANCGTTSGAGGGVTSVTGTAPISSSGGATPAISCSGCITQSTGGVVPTSANLLSTTSAPNLAAATQTNVNAVGYVAGGGTANAQTATLSPAVASLTSGLQVCWKPTAANSTTTPTLAVNGLAATTIVKVGGAALAASDLTTSAIACAIYDGTNFELQNPQTAPTSGGITQAYQTVDSNGTAVTQRSVLNIIPGGSINASCVDNSGATRTDCTISGVNGPPAPTVNLIGSTSYTIQNSDLAWRDVFSGGTVAVTLPQANQISVSPFIATRYNNILSSCTACTTSSFSQNAGDTLVLSVNGTPASTISSVSATVAGTTYTLQPSPGFNWLGSTNRSLWMYTATNVPAGTGTVTVNFSSSSSPDIRIVEYTTGAFDRTAYGTAIVPGPGASATIPVTNTSDVVVALTSIQNFSAGGGCQTGYNQRVSNGDGAFCDTVVNSVASATFTVPPAEAPANAVVIAGFAVTGIPTFTTGWYVILENAGTGLVTVTPTTSTIGGQTTLVLVPNETCEVMSDGTNYNVSWCATKPNVQTNGVMGQLVEIAGVNTSATNADVSTTTLIATGGTNAFYDAEAEINCTTSTSSAVETLTLTYTDTSNTVQTSTAQVTCTTLGSASIASVHLPFRAKASTNIQYGTVHTTAQATYDVSVAIYQLATK